MLDRLLRQMLARRHGPKYSEKKQIKKATQVLEEESGVGTNLESLPADETPSINEVRSKILRG